MSNCLFSSITLVWRNSMSCSFGTCVFLHLLTPYLADDTQCFLKVKSMPVLLATVYLAQSSGNSILLGINTDTHTCVYMRICVCFTGWCMTAAFYLKICWREEIWESFFVALEASIRLVGRHILQECRYGLNEKIKKKKKRVIIRIPCKYHKPCRCYRFEI